MRTKQWIFRIGVLVVPALCLAQGDRPEVAGARMSPVFQPMAASTCRLAVRGQKQGQFKGQTGRPDKWIPCSQFLLALTSPRDTATGMASGKRRYEPIMVTKEWGAASPQVFQAAATNEVLPLVEFEFLRTNPQGQEFVFESVTLTNATISGVKQHIGFPDRGEPPNPRPLEDVSFTFQKIEITNNEGKTMFMDDWSR